MGLPSIDIADFNYGRQSVNGSVLVADGDKQLGKQLSIVSDKMGYDVVVRGNGERALDLFIERSFDVVFTALKMPGMDGLTLSLQVKASSLNSPVVLILDEHLEYFMNRIKAGRIDCAVSKPLSFGEIQKMAQYFVANRHGFGPAVGLKSLPALGGRLVSHERSCWPKKNSQSDQKRNITVHRRARRDRRERKFKLSSASSAFSLVKYCSQ
jgi:DNA-binding response OmpR family regulator